MFRKILKISGILLAALVVSLFALFLGFWIATSAYRLDDEKLKLNFEMTTFYDGSGETLERNAAEAVKLSEIPLQTVQAFLAVEDRTFYEHKGVNFKRIAGAALKNLASFSFKEGGSTISQQLVKNTHLTNEKTLKRKFAELRLTRELEASYTKDQILELYLNSIYFGKCGYGIANAAKGFYGKSPEDLTLAESASLAGVIQSPSLYSPYLHPEKFLARRNLVLRLMRDQQMIEETQFERAAAEPLALCDGRRNDRLAYLNGALSECTEILGISEEQINSRNLKIYTYLDENLQKAAETVSKQRIQTAQYYAKCENSIVIMDNENAAVLALAATNPFGAERKRQPASTIKPLLVYGPALENGLIEPATLLSDRKEEIGGFTPSNYHDKYYGNVSARFALANSLNVPAVRLLNDLGVDKAARYLEANGMQVDAESRHLASALGGFTQGMTLPELCNGYRTIAAGGVYRPFRFVRRIEDRNGKVLYESSSDFRGSRRVFSEETSFLLNDMLSDSVKSGTAKTLRPLGIPLCAKTGTNGNEKGNRDAYTLSYNRAYTVGCWIGSDTSFDNSITGSTLPCLASRDLWQQIVASAGRAQTANWGFSPPSGVRLQRIDGETLKQDQKFVLADENAPEESVITDYFRTPILERSEKYSRPAVRAFRVVRKDNVLAGEFFGEKGFRYRIYDECAGERKEIFMRDGENGRIEFSTDPLQNAHRILVVAEYRAKKILGEAVCSEEFRFPCNFVPAEPKQDPEQKEEDSSAQPKQDPDRKEKDSPDQPDEKPTDSENAWWW